MPDKKANDKDTAMKTIVFVCSGNTCRSPMAEGICRVLLRENGIEGVECTSCGLDAETGAPATGKAVRAARAYGADIFDHESRPLGRSLLKRGDLFVCMTENQAQELTVKYHVPPDKVIVLDIADPYEGDEMEYADCAYEIHNALLDLLKQNRFDVG